MVQLAVEDEAPAVSGWAVQPEIGLEPSRKATVPEAALGPVVAGVTVAV